MKGTVRNLVLLAVTLGLSGPAAFAEQASIDLQSLGAASADALRNNSAQMTMNQSGDSYAVRITMPSRLEHPFSSPKLDQFALEKEVTFKLSEGADGSVHLSNIKGFKIHSVEKQMWVNLLGVDFGAPDAQGQHESVISAGKMGVVKQVNSTISPRTYEPIAGIIASIHGGASPQSLPIAGQPTTTDSPTAAASITPADNSSPYGQTQYGQTPNTQTASQTNQTTYNQAPSQTTATQPASPGWNEPVQAPTNSYPSAPTQATTYGASPSNYMPQPTTVQSTYTPVQTTNSVPSSYSPPPTTTRVYAPPPASSDLTGDGSLENQDLAASNVAPPSLGYGNGNSASGNVETSGGSYRDRGILQEAAGAVKKVLDDDDDDDDDDEDDRAEMRRKQLRKQQLNSGSNQRKNDDDDDDDDDGD